MPVSKIQTLLPQLSASLSVSHYCRKWRWKGPKSRSAVQQPSACWRPWLQSPAPNIINQGRVIGRGYGLALEHLPRESPSSTPSTIQTLWTITKNYFFFCVGDRTQSLANVHKHFRLLLQPVSSVFPKEWVRYWDWRAKGDDDFG